MLILFYRVSMFCIRVFAVSMYWKKQLIFPSVSWLFDCYFFVPNTCEENFFIATGLSGFKQTLLQQVCLISKRKFMLILFYRVSMFCIVRRVFAACMHWQYVKNNRSFFQVCHGCLLVTFFCSKHLWGEFFIASGLSGFYQTLQQLSLKNFGKSKKH